MRTATSVGIALTAALLGVSPLAHADNDSFVRDLKNLGFVQSSPNLISTARSACYFLDRNRDPEQIRDRISRYLAVDLSLANTFFAMSVHEYCPWYGSRIDG
ncbi:DUF732 domain-containing protein [Mycobacterium sp. CVI_P3]|uniref:DUF732 domain-containing protein n=1 Tax=Mycobacterium pinniadriaticum TaxID=2994102 RepID=A0ABT3SBW9_9MYCO|nr:DUF732 domain-containing protein [Mycobacterium pinniadriaticum]MCX2930577.1 DUF732 domain-containing protein [Mycobacterium pinniadriaticum]MCX2937001.1 DUF732 domain-containing protein [Mycobacterium pinniadriaticum]